MLNYIKALFFDKLYISTDIVCEAYGSINALNIPLVSYSLTGTKLILRFSRPISPNEQFIIQWYKFYGYVDIYNFHVSDSIFLRRFNFYYNNSKEKYIVVKDSKNLSFTLSLDLFTFEA